MITAQHEILHEHRKHCLVCGSTSLAHPDRFCPIGRQLVADLRVALELARRQPVAEPVEDHRFAPRRWRP